MLKSIIFKLFNLQTFADGGGAGGAAGGEGAGEATAADAGKAQAKPGGKAEAGVSQVIYGKQEAEAAAPEEADAQKTEQQEPEKPAKRQSFDELMKSDPEYQREMQKRIDQAINRRFAKAKSAEEQNAKLAPALNLLATKYGVEAGNVDQLIEAINGDSDLIEQQAMDAGMEPDAYREYQRIKAENEAFKKAEAERQRQAQIESAYKEWQAQAQEAQLIYPGLDLAAESRNEQFLQLLGAGINVCTAYEVVHQDEIQRGLISRAAADAQKQTLAKIASKQGRPRENATSKPQAATVKSDPSKLTTKDFDEIMRRAARGDVIRF